MDTVVIEISAVYKDKTKGMKTSIDGMDKFSKSIDKTKQQMDKAARSTDNWYQKIKNIAGKVISVPVKIIDYATKPLRSLYNFATSLKGVLTGLFVGKGFNTLVSSPLGLADAYSRARIGFETLFQSASKAQKMMNEIDEFAIKTPFNTSNVISNIQKMMAYGWDASRMLSDMEIIGNAAAATGKGDQGLESIVYALSEIKSKGKLSTQELNQLASAGIKAKQYLAEGLGFGTDDAGMAKLAKAIEKGKVGANQAVDLILEGMKEFDGMMDKTANETVGGLKSQLEDLFEVNIARRWGQGLQDGAKRGLGTIASFLDENRGKLEAFGDQLYEIGETLSNWLADRAEKAIDSLLKVTNSAEFKNADLGGKFKIVWNEVVAEPFNAWWNGEGGTKFKAKAEEIGTSIGEWIANGFAKVISNIIPKMFDNASKVLPGGASPDSSSWMSAAILAYGANSLGLGKAAGWALGKIPVASGGAAAAGAATTAGSAAAGAGGAAAAGGIGLSGIAGIVLGGMGLISAINDFVGASKSYTEARKHEYNTRGVTKASMVAIGAGIGTAIAPGVGTAIGAAIGGGAALLGGNSVGSWISGEVRGTNKYKRVAKNIEEAAEGFETATVESKTFNEELEKLKDINAIMTIAQSSDSVKKETLTSLKNALKDIDGQTAELTVKKSKDSLTDAEVDKLEQLQTNGIIIKALINKGGDLGEDDIAVIEKRLANLSETKLQIYAQLASGKGDPNDLKAQLKKIEDEGLVLNAVLNPTVDNVSNAWATVTETGVELEAKLKVAKTPEEIAALQEQIDQNDQYKLMLKATIQNFDETELSAFKQSISDATQSLIDASNGLLTTYELLNGPIDSTIEKAEETAEAKRKEAERKLEELRAETALGEVYLPEQEQRMDEIQAKIDEYYAGGKTRNAALEETAELVGAARRENLDSGGLSQERKLYYEGEFKKLFEKYSDTGIYDGGLLGPNLLSFLSNGRLDNMSWARILEGGTWYRKDLLEGMEENKNSYTAGIEEYLSAMEQEYASYKATKLGQRTIMQQDTSEYGGTKDELIKSAAEGNYEDAKNLVRMLNDIVANESRLTPEDRYNPTEIMEAFEASVPNWFAAQFAGAAKSTGNGIEDTMYNKLIELGNALVGTANSITQHTEALFTTKEDGSFGERKKVEWDGKSTAVSIEGETKTQEEVKAIQQALIAAGFDLSKHGADGLWGKETQAAWQKFSESGITAEQLSEKLGVATKAAEEFAKALGIKEPDKAGQGGKGDTEGSGTTPLVKNSTEGIQWGLRGFKSMSEIYESLNPKKIGSDGAVGTVDTSAVEEGVNKVSESSDSFASKVNAMVGKTDELNTSAGYATDAVKNVKTVTDDTKTNLAALNTDVGAADGSMKNFGFSASTADGSVSAMGATSGATAGFISGLGDQSIFADGAIGNLGDGAAGAFGKMLGAGNSGLAAAGAFGLATLTLGGVIGALASKASQIRNISIPSVVGGGYTKKAEGDILTGPEFILAGEDGDEAIIPLSQKHRRRGMALFKEAAKRMGIPVMGNGGIVEGNEGSSGPVNASVSSPSGGISVSLGGVNFTIQTSSGDSEGIISAIKANMPSVANEVANVIAAALEQTYSNMATKGV